MVSWAQLSQLHPLLSGPPQPHFLGLQNENWALDVGQPCWAMCRTLTLLCCQHCFGHKSNTRLQTGCCSENWLCPSQTVHPRARWEVLESKFRLEPLTRSDRWVGSLLLKAPFAVSVLWGLRWCCVHWSAYLVWSEWGAPTDPLTDCCCI